MGLFGFIGDVVGATVKVALTPVAIVKDVVNIATDNEANSTKDLVKSAASDLSDAVDEIIP